MYINKNLDKHASTYIVLLAGVEPSARVCPFESNNFLLEALVDAATLASLSASPKNGGLTMVSGA
jgi:hypothetical protein